MMVLHCLTTAKKLSICSILRCIKPRNFKKINKQQYRTLYGVVCCLFAPDDELKWSPYLKLKAVTFEVKVKLSISENTSINSLFWPQILTVIFL